MEKINTSGATNHLVTITIGLDLEKECIDRIYPAGKTDEESDKIDKILKNSIKPDKFPGNENI